jgi:hypothetical protein
MLSYTPREYFKASESERQDVEIQFSNVPGNPS